MRILQLTPEVPRPAGGTGGQTRQFELLRRLAERGDDVTVVAPVHPDDREAVAALPEHGIALRAAHRPAGARGLEVLRALRRRPELAVRLAREPVTAWQTDVFWTALRPLARRAIAERRPDVVLVEHDWAAGWIGDLPAGLPAALTLHNLSWAYHASRARAAPGGAGLAQGVEARRYAAHDARHLPAYRLLVTMSDLDARIVGDRLGLAAHAVPNGVDTAALDLPPPSGEPVVLFTGRLDYPPNAEALLWLLRDIWPQVRRGHPGARLVVVGRGASPEARALAGEDVELAGFVPSVAPLFERASVVVVPMLSGGGTRLKVLDALASGRGLVSTRVGAMGVDVRDGEHALLADSAEDVAAAVVRLLGDVALTRRLGASARRLAEERYEWSALGDRLRELLVRASTRS